MTDGDVISIYTHDGLEFWNMLSFAFSQIPSLYDIT